MGQRRVDLRLRRDMRMVRIDAPQVGQRRHCGVKRPAGPLCELHRRLDRRVGVLAHLAYRAVCMVQTVQVAVLPRAGERGLECVDALLELHRGILHHLFAFPVGSDRHKGVHREKVRGIAFRLRRTAHQTQKQQKCRQNPFHIMLLAIKNPFQGNTASLCGIALIIIHRSRMRKAGFCGCDVRRTVVR